MTQQINQLMAGPTKIIIDGNDGLGKSTIVSKLKSFGFYARDRGWATKATDNLEIGPEENSITLILNGSVETSQERLLKAGKDITEKYHTREDLAYYSQKFLTAFDRYRDHNVYLINAEDTEENVFKNVLDCLGIKNRKIRVAFPSGRLKKILLDNKQISDLFFPELSQERKYSHNSKYCNIIIAKPKAIGELLVTNQVDIAFVGNDVLEEYEYPKSNQTLIQKLNAKLCVVGPKDEKTIIGTPTIASEFPELASKTGYISLNSYGSTEGWIPLISDFALEIVETGNTIVQNNLKIYKEIMDISLVLAASESMRSSVVWNKLYNLRK